MTTVNEFSGTWTYRSYKNLPEFKATDNEVHLVTADLELGIEYVSDDDCGEVSGKLIMHNGSSIHLNVSGTAEPGEPPTIQFRGAGPSGTPTDGWIYDYIGYLAPSWPEGDQQQRPAIVGTVIRVLEHKAFGEDEMRKAGEVLSFIAVLRERSPVVGVTPA